MILHKTIKTRSNITLCIPLSRRNKEAERLGGMDAEVLCILLNEKECTVEDINEAVEWLQQLWIKKYDSSRTHQYRAVTGCDCVSG